MPVKQTMRQRSLGALVGAAMAATGSGSLAATTYNWTGSTDQDWGTAGNWVDSADASHHAVPVGNSTSATSDSATLSAATASYIVNFTSADGALYSDTARLASLDLSTTGANTLVLNVSGTGLFSGFGTSNHVLAVDGNSTVNIQAGGWVSGVGDIRTSGGSTIKVNGGTLAGTSSSGGRAFVGSATDGNLQVTDGTFSLASQSGGIYIGYATSGTTGGSTATGHMTVSETTPGATTITINGGAIIGEQVNTSGSRNAAGILDMSGGTWTQARGGTVRIGYVSSNIGQAGGPIAATVSGALNLSGGLFMVAAGRDGTMNVGDSGTDKTSSTGTLAVSGTGTLGESASNPISTIAVSADSASTTGHTAGTGILTQSGGTIYVKQLTALNGVKSTIALSGGTLNSGGTDFDGINGSGGTTFVVGNGTAAATLNLMGGGSGTHSFAGGLSVSSNAFITGAGTVNGAASVQGSLSAGGTASAVGAIVFNDGLTLGSGANSVFDITDPSLAALSFDQISNDGGDAASFGGTLTLAFSGGSYADGSIIPIFSGFGSYAGNFSSVHYSGLEAGQQAIFNAATGAVSIAAVPEPATVTLIAIGGVLTLGRRRRRVR